MDPVSPSGAVDLPSATTIGVAAMFGEMLFVGVLMVNPFSVGQF